MNRLTRIWLVSVICGALVAVPESFTSPDEAIIVVVARDRAGRPIGRLQASDFKVAVDGLPVPVKLVIGAPRRFLVLLDFSTSMFGGTAVQGRWHSDNPQSVTGSRIGVVTREWARRGVQTLSEQLQPGENIRLASFGASLNVTPPSSGMESLNQAWPSVFQADGPSPIWDAVSAGVGLLSAAGGRSVLILLTDGRATASHLGFDDAVLIAAESPVTVYTTGPAAALEERFGNDTDLLDPVTALDTLAKRTGGRLLVPGRGSDFRDIVTRIVEDLRQHYTLSVSASITETSRITVAVPAETATVTTRVPRG